jgi:4-amino-4-deoxy-L-arabinose transferase-like glycosyltransferase
VAAGTAALYFYNLGAVGVLGPDEPRYVAIGRAMAQTGDLVTPRLWGSPWFEKPPLLYWMTAAGVWSGLSPDLCGRVPVVILSLLFLLASFLLLRREFGDLSAGLATTALASSAGWLAESDLALTDIPLAVCFSLAVWLALPMIGGTAQRPVLRIALMGIAIGLGALAKGLVPIALTVPFVWFLRRYWKLWWIGIVTCLIVALPWYLAVYARNGYPFIEEFFIRHHFQRLYSSSLQHVQPWWYYFPVLLLGTFPWTPLLFTGMRRSGWDARRMFLLSVVVFGFVMFSVSLNKLPGYLLPLIPALFALICSRIESIDKRWMFACAVLIALIPLTISVIPGSLENGRLSWSAMRITKPEWFFVALPMAAVLLARRSWLPHILLLCITASTILLKTKVDPVLDSDVSARGLWRQIAPIADDVCDAWTNRDWLYGLNFYAQHGIAPCTERATRYQLSTQGRRKPQVTAR